MKPVKEMTQAELGAYVQSHLRSKGLDIVLSGGAAVAVFTKGEYVSKDLDFVNRFSVGRSNIRKGMMELGFVEESRHYRHPDSHFLVEFPPGPLTVGSELVQCALYPDTLSNDR